MTFLCCSCQKDLIEYQQNDIKVSVQEGAEWIHDYSLFLGLKKKNPPQIAIWAEDTAGNYLSTIYVSHSLAKQKWIGAKEKSAKRILPYWGYAYAKRKNSPSSGADGTSGATSAGSTEPVVDALTGATPKGSFDVKLIPAGNPQKFVIKAEFNHSTDFNDTYIKTDDKGHVYYSGGKDGSGQPSVVYAAVIDTESGKKQIEAQLIGHSNHNGSNGDLYTDLSTLTTALNIVKRITVTIE